MTDDIDTILVRTGGEPDRKVDALVAFIAIDPKTEKEGIMSVGDNPAYQFPLVFTAGSPGVDYAVKLARQAIQISGYRIEMRRFECVNRENIMPKSTGTSKS
jgi:hypothetical protein